MPKQISTLPESLRAAILANKKLARTSRHRLFLRGMVDRVAHAALPQGRCTVRETSDSKTVTQCSPNSAEVPEGEEHKKDLEQDITISIVVLRQHLRETVLREHQSRPYAEEIEQYDRNCSYEQPPFARSLLSESSDLMFPETGRRKREVGCS